MELSEWLFRGGTALGAVGLAGAALWQAVTARRRHEEQTKADRERRITETFAKATEQLGSDKREVRLGAIYTFERLAEEREYWPIMETLTAVVRERAPWPPVGAPVDPEGHQAKSAGVEPAASSPRLETDVQAVLTVLGRRSEARLKQDQEKGRRLNLKHSNLRRAQLQHAHLEHADFDGACFQQADCEQAYLQGASLCNADLWGAIFVETHLEGARFWKVQFSYVLLGMAHLEKACLVDTRFEMTLLDGAHLDGAELMGADLRGAVGLSAEQLKDAIGDKATKLPGHVAPPGHWLEQGLKAHAAE